jgi:hypothetical protein
MRVKMTMIAVAFFGIWLVVCGTSNVAGDEPKTKSGTITGELKSKKDTPDGKNTFIEVLAPGEEKPRRYHVLYDEKAKGPIAPVLKDVRAAKVGDEVEFEWVQTGHGPAIKTFQVVKKGGGKPDK